MSFFIYHKKQVAYCPYLQANSNIKTRNQSNIYLTRFGPLFVLNSTGRCIVDWIERGDRAVVLPSERVGYAVLLDTQRNLRQITIASDKNEVRCAAYPFDTVCITNMVFCANKDEEEKIQFSLDEGHTLTETLKAMLRFNIEYRDAIIMDFEKIKPDAASLKMMQPFYNPNLKDPHA